MLEFNLPSPDQITASRIPTALLPILVMMVLLAGCQNSIEPFDKTQGFYSVYGNLNLNENYNYIRVKDLNVPVKKGSGKNLNLTVTLENLDRSRSQVLEDSVVRFEEVYTHNYRTSMEMYHAERYRVTVVDSAGNRLSAETRTPNRAEENAFPRVPQCDVTFELSYHNLRDVKGLSVDAAIEFRERKYWVDLPVTAGDSTGEAQFRFKLKELIDAALYKHGYNAWCHHLSQDSLFVRYDHYSSDFFEQLESDTVTLPGGTGRFGAMYHESYRLEIDTTNVCFPYCGKLEIDPDDCPPNCGQAF